MPIGQLIRTGYGQLELLFAVMVVCAFLAIVMPLIIERVVARRGH